MSCFKVFRRGSKNSYNVTDPYEQSHANARYSINDKTRYSSSYDKSPEEENGQVLSYQRESTSSERNEKLQQIQAGLNDENRNEHKQQQQQQQQQRPIITVTTSDEVAEDIERSHQVETEIETRTEREEVVQRDSDSEDQVVVEQTTVTRTEEVRRSSVSSSEGGDSHPGSGSTVEIRTEETRTEEIHRRDSDHDEDSTVGTSWDSQPNAEASVVQVTQTTTTVVRTDEAETSSHSDHSSDKGGDDDDEGHGYHHHQEEDHTITTTTTTTTTTEYEDEPQVAEQTETNVSVIRISSERDGDDDRSSHHSDYESENTHNLQNDASVSVVQVDSTEAVATFTAESDEDDGELDDNRQNEEAEFQSSVVVVTHEEIHVQPDGETTDHTTYETHEGGNHFDSTTMVY